MIIIQHEVVSQIVLFCFETLPSRKECWNLTKQLTFDFLSGFYLFSQVLGQVKKWFILESHEMIRILHVAGWLMVLILLCVIYWQGGVLRLMKSGSISSIFNCSGLFLQAYKQVKERLILEMHEMIRLSFLCAVFFSFLGILVDRKGFSILRIFRYFRVLPQAFCQFKN